MIAQNQYTPAEIEAHLQDLEQALRSGEYRQGAHALRTQDGPEPGNWLFCCIGVGSDRCGLGTWRPGSTECSVYTIGEGNEASASDAYFLPEVAEYYGIRTSIGEFEWKAIDAKVRELWQDQAEAIASWELGHDCQNLRDKYIGSLTLLNDLGLPFPCIADIISLRPTGLLGPYEPRPDET